MARPPRIDRDLVVHAAIRVLDAEGPGGLSLERLADELDIKAPTLYYYYADKSAILDAVALSLLGDLGIVEPADDWRDRLVQFCLAFHRRLSEHPNVVVVLIEHMPADAVLAAFEANARKLDRAGVPDELRAVILEGTQHFLWGMTVYRSVGAVNPAFAGDVDPQRHPNWAKALAAKPFDDEHFLEVGVRALLDGLVRAAIDTEGNPNGGRP